jgi:hypothetical protein
VVRRKKEGTRKDPLLKYLHQARNADEHGIGPVSRLEPGQVSIRADGPLLIERGIFGPERIELTTAPGSAALMLHITAARAHLVTVTDDRFGDAFDAPTRQNGTPIADTSLLGVAGLGLSITNCLLLRRKRSSFDDTSIPGRFGCCGRSDRRRHAPEDKVNVVTCIRQPDRCGQALRGPHPRREMVSHSLASCSGRRHRHCDTVPGGSGAIFPPSRPQAR